MNLWQKIIEVRKSITELIKDKEGYQYSYVTGNQILGKIKNAMDEQGLILQPATELGEYRDFNYKTKYDKDKLAFLISGNMSYTWINAEDPTEREVVTWTYYGQQDDDLAKAFGTALTYAERYFLLKYFGVPTDEDDPDAKQGEPKQTPKKTYDKPKATGERKVSQFDIINMGKRKGYEGEKLYKKLNVKKEDDIKYMKADRKIEVYDKLSTLADK